MKALRVADENSEALPEDIPRPILSSTEEVEVEIHYSSLNYKDALAVTGKGRILKKYPLTPGIDAAGTVLQSKNPLFKEGDAVLVTGCGTGEERDGGYAEFLVTPSAAVIPLPTELTVKRAMFFGTAGFTAALAVDRMIQNEQSKEKGPILVTGATGGVGQFSVSILSHLGFEVWALTGKKPTQEQHLKSLGASEVVTLEELELGSRPLGRVKFGGVIDNLGGDTLSKAIAHTQLWGNVASIGLAADFKINTTVMPFILRGVSLLGVSSNNCPRKRRESLWAKLAGEWNNKTFDLIPTEEISLGEVLEKSKSMLARKTSGRIVVKIRKEL